MFVENNLFQETEEETKESVVFALLNLPPNRLLRSTKRMSETLSFDKKNAVLAPPMPPPTMHTGSPETRPCCKRATKTRNMPLHSKRFFVFEFLIKRSNRKQQQHDGR
jgi:hypothetical protein